MSEKKKEAEAGSLGAKVWASFATTALGFIASLISALVGSAELFRAPIAIFAAIGAALVIAAFTFVLARRERGPSRIAKLKNELAGTYLSVLDGSAFNPNAKERL